MENLEDAAWVFDSLVGFLHGPIWNAPLQTFIEEKSLIFEPADNGQILDKEEYLSIHEEYKNLVDLMLGSYMEDIGITPEQFEMACQMSKENVEGLPMHFHQRLFEQIWAANDYNVFTRMMTQRNVELQLQALELIERRSGTMPHSYLPYDETADSKVEYPDASIMEEVKKLSLEEAQIGSDEDLGIKTDVQEIRKEKEHLRSALDNFQKHISMKESEIQLASSLSVDEESATKEIESENDATTSNKSSNEIKAPLKPLKEDIEQRQQYLKQQRDKLLTLKRQIREKQLSDSTDSTIEVNRPKSAKTAQLMLSGGIMDKAIGQDSSLQLRKALADRLRSEVVDKL